MRRPSGLNAQWLTTFECPSCGADLYARPPRSYAELEGFVETDERTTKMLSNSRPRLSRADFQTRRRATARRAKRAELLVIGSIVLCFGLIIASGVVTGFLI